VVEAVRPLVVWRFCDAKPGHDRQSAGLVAALGRRLAIETCTFDTRAIRVTPLQFARAQLPFAASAPDLIIGAGRACQWPMLASRRARGGYTAYLMKPAWPIACFDVCLIPHHDRPPENPRVIATEGVLNDISTDKPQGDGGLILIGGPSAHFSWNGKSLIEQVQAIIDAFPQKSWTLANSRRTPPTTSSALGSLAREGVRFADAGSTDEQWLAGEFARADTIWVSGDSVSMMYEALSTGAGIGILDVPAKRDSRISRIADRLGDRGLAVRFADWRSGVPISAGAPLREADRCAELILARLPCAHAAARGA